MSADLDRLLSDAARGPLDDLDVADVHARGRRLSAARRALVGAGTIALVAVAVGVLPSLLPTSSTPAILDAPDPTPATAPTESEPPRVAGVALPVVELAELPGRFKVLHRSNDGAGGLRAVEVLGGATLDVGLAPGSPPDPDRLVVAVPGGGVAFGSTCTDEGAVDRGCVLAFVPDDPRPTVTPGAADVVGVADDGSPLVLLDPVLAGVAVGDELRVLRAGQLERVVPPHQPLSAATVRSAAIDPESGAVALLRDDGSMTVVSTDGSVVASVPGDRASSAGVFWRAGRVVAVRDDDGPGRAGVLVESFDPADPGTISSTGVPLADVEVTQVVHDRSSDLLAVSLRDPSTGADVAPMVVEFAEGPDGLALVPRRLAPVAVDGFGELTGRLLLRPDVRLDCAAHPGLFSPPTPATGIWFVCFDAGDARGDGYVRLDAGVGAWPAATDAAVGVTDLQSLLDAWAAGPTGDTDGLTGGLEAGVATLDVVSLDDGVATLDVVSGLQAGILSTSTGGATFELQVVSLLTQFDAVDAVAFTLDGDCAAWWEFRQAGPTCLPPASRGAWDR